ncbi:MAG: putative N-formylglutamate amidohydrolase [Gammaproteobacteria bacterium]|jgi:predicted N-formylglutamate amidohydrolase
MVNLLIVCEMDVCSVLEAQSGFCPAVVVLTCEHAGREVPDSYRALLSGQRANLNSHLGYDPGAFGMAVRMAANLSAPLVFTNTTRLLIDTNRSLQHPHLFSSIAAGLTGEERKRIIDRFYTPYRGGVERLIRAAVNMQHRVLHISVHSFTDVLDGVCRDVDIGLLCDTRRHSESSVCHDWLTGLNERADHLRHRLNEPYQGVDDGLTTELRTKFAAPVYAGLEVEVRQGLITGARAQRAMADLLTSCLKPLIRCAAGVCGSECGSRDSSSAQ